MNLFGKHFAERTTKHGEVLAVDKHLAVINRSPPSDHTIGGAVMGLDPKTSVLNRYQQSWDVHNVFVLGASSFPNNAGYNPTSTIGALSLWTAKAIIDQYLAKPGPLVEVPA